MDIIGRKIKFSNTGGDVVLFIKAREKEPAAKILEKIKPGLEKLVNDPKKDLDILEAGRRRDMRVASGSYNDGITNPNGPISLTEDILINAPSPDAGASYAFTHKFEFDWPRIDSQSGGAQDEMVGRNPDGASLPQHATFSHIHRVNVKNRNQGQLKIMRKGLSLGVKRGHAGREKGLMFVSFCKQRATPLREDS
jgi:Dyp-type peroxidase family